MTNMFQLTIVNINKQNKYIVNLAEMSGKLMYIKVGNKPVKNAAVIWFIFHDFPVPRPDSITFQVLTKIFKFQLHDLTGTVCTLSSVMMTNIACCTMMCELCQHSC